MENVYVDPIPFDRLLSVLAPGRAEVLSEFVAMGEQLLDGRKQWNVNATATGGGVAEMLRGLLSYTGEARKDNRQTGWLVLDGNAEFFALTKRIHNLLHGSVGDGGPLGDEERVLYESVVAENLASLREFINPEDVVVLHDPQTAGLVAGLQEMGVHVVWRCHVGRDTDNEQTLLVWDFLRPYIEHADALIFSRAVYAPPWVDQNKLRIIPPALDPFTAKNRELSQEEVEAALRVTGLVDFPGVGGPLKFDRRDGSIGTVRPQQGLILGDQIVPADAQLVLQVSRWDRLKDMAGVMKGFADHIDEMPENAHLMLVGPDVSGVTDDPEGAEVLQECREVWEAQPPEARRRLHLCSLPMDDTDENAHIVNALQYHAAVVVQKSLVEGFGLTVTEGMWKGRPMVASRVGGIQDQIIHEEHGLLVDDPYDLAEYAAAVRRLLEDPELAERLGAAARERVRHEYLGDRYMIQYVELFSQLLDVH